MNVTIPGLGKRFMLTKTLEWNLHWCILDAMLDDNFCIKEDFKHDVPKLQRRFRHAAHLSHALLLSSDNSFESCMEVKHGTGWWRDLGMEGCMQHGDSRWVSYVVVLQQARRGC